MYEIKINDLFVTFSKHAKDRLEERGVNLNRIAYSLHDRYKTLRHYKHSDQKLCYNSKGLSIVFRIHGKTLVVVTVMDFENTKNVDAVVI